MEFKFDYVNELIDITIEGDDGKLVTEIISFENFEEALLDVKTAMNNMWSSLKWEGSD